MISRILSTSEALVVCPSYPIGLAGNTQYIDYTALDVTRDGTYVVVGGECNDPQICTNTLYLPDPIIELVETATRQFTWTKQIVG